MADANLLLSKGAEKDKRVNINQNTQLWSTSNLLQAHELSKGKKLGDCLLAWTGRPTMATKRLSNKKATNQWPS
eukprot:1853186-Amphidinium_carterae.2